VPAVLNVKPPLEGPVETSSTVSPGPTWARAVFKVQADSAVEQSPAPCAVGAA